MMTIDYLELRETLLTFSAPDGTILFKGTPDHLLYYPKRRLIIINDAKFGRKPVQAAAMNMQLRCYLAMAAQDPEFAGAEFFYGSIMAPRIADAAHAVRYTRKDIDRAIAEINAIWEESIRPTAPRCASAVACDYCTAKPVCAEFAEFMKALERIEGLPARTWTPEQWNLFLERRNVVKNFIEDRYEEAKQIKMAFPEAIPDWDFKPGNEVRKVGDIVKAWAVLEPYVNAQQFSSACSLSIGDIERVIWLARRDTTEKLTQKETKELVNAALKDLIEVRRNQPSLVKIDPK